MKVYRYENAQGLGPYNSVWEGKELLCQAHSDYNHPTPLAEKWDGLGYSIPSSHNVYGCPTLGLLNQWFAGWHDWLTEYGFSVVEYDVPAHHVRTCRSGLQVAFLRP